MQKRKAEATEPDNSWLPSSDDKGVDLMTMFMTFEINFLMDHCKKYGNFT